MAAKRFEVNPPWSGKGGWTAGYEPHDWAIKTRFKPHDTT